MGLPEELQEVLGEVQYQDALMPGKLTEVLIIQSVGGLLDI